MALQLAPVLGGDFIKLTDVARNGPVLAVFRIKEFQPPEPATGFNGTNVPVIADVWFIDGPMAGEVHLGERFLGAITAQLRGVRNPNAQKGIGVQAPANEVGAEIVCQVKVVNQGRSNEGVQADPPSPSVLEQIIEPAYRAMGGEQLWANAERAAAQSAAQQSAQAVPAQHQVASTQLGQAAPVAAASPVGPQVDAQPVNGRSQPDQAQLLEMLAQLQAAQQATPAQPAPESAVATGEPRPVWAQPTQ